MGRAFVADFFFSFFFLPVHSLGQWNFGLFSLVVFFLFFFENNSSIKIH